MSEQSIASTSSTKDLKRVLGRADLFGMSIGQIVGSGIMSLTGVAIAMTGRSVPISFILAAVFVILTSGASVLVSGTVRLKGGFYTQVAMLTGKKFGGVYLIIFILTNISISMYALSFADYFMGLAGLDPSLRKGIAAFIILMFYVLNVTGVGMAAKIQNIIVLLMCVALALFSAFGIFHIRPDYFVAKGYFSGGAFGLLKAAALLTFATGGATQILNFGAEAKNPTKDIPFVIIISTLAIAVIYAFMATVAAGVLPIAEVAGKPLTAVAKTVLPAPLYVFFMVGGAMFALLSTLNAQMGWATKPILQGVDDGWFPKFFGTLTKKKTPIVLLTMYLILGLIPVVSGIDIGGIANYALVLNYLTLILLSFSILFLPKAIPDLWKKSAYHCSEGVLWAFAIGGALVSIAQIYFLASSWTPLLIVGNIGILVASFIYCSVREKMGLVHMEISYEEN